jgi:hypothetical protein
MKGYDFTLCLLCAKWDSSTKLRKVSESRLEKKKKNILRFEKLFYVILHMFMEFKC